MKGDKMTERSINQVKRVIEVEHSINKYLTEGWMLLSVYLGSTASDHGPAQYPVYVLGWTSDEESPSEIQDRIRAEEDLARITELREINQRALDPDA